MKNQVFLNEEEFEAYKLDCGCEGVNIPGIGWQSTLCDKHEAEEEELSFQPKHFTKFRTSREI